jgi:DNA-binding transcriptional ArsR family regulator
MNVAQEERILKSFSNRRRIAIVRHLKKGRSATVGDIADTIKLSFKATSKHLAILAAAGVLDRDQLGLLMYYKLSKDMPKLAQQIVAAL